MDEAPNAGSRPTLTRERVLVGALALADAIGVEAFTMRRLADALGVKPMTIYHHVASKELILDGIVDLVFAEIDLPPQHLPWREAIRHRCLSARAALRRHPWAPAYMESRRSPGPALLTHHDAVLACLRRGGFSLPLTAHAYAVLDAYLYGFALQEAAIPVGGAAEVAALADDILRDFPMEAYPSFVAFTLGHVLRPGYSFGASFEVGLDLILDGLERARAADPRTGSAWDVPTPTG